jgi:hypothetical protein
MIVVGITSRYAPFNPEKTQSSEAIAAYVKQYSPPPRTFKPSLLSTFHYPTSSTSPISTELADITII